MRKIYLSILLLTSIQSFSQTSEPSTERAIKTVINQFFEALEKQDTVLLKKIAFTEGQIWRLNNVKDPASYGARFFRDDLSMFDPETTFLEEALSYEIKVHRGLAMAWVPYEFRLNGTFSHCGVDIFTLIKTEEGWKIANLSYTVDQEGCNK